MNQQFTFRKSFGQNFLKDTSIVRKIVATVPLTKEDLVIEVGPGSGMLTKEIAPHVKQMLCYEIDTRLEEILATNLQEFSNIDIVFEDFMTRDISADLAKYEYKKLYFIANLPYYITTPIITKLIESHLPFESITVMVQKEVGNRFSAKPGSKDYGFLTVFLNYYFDVKKEFVVSRNCFVPKPNVDSVIVTLKKKETKFRVNNEEHFLKLVKDSFQYKRKSIRNNLKSYDLEKIESVLKTYGYDLKVRAESLQPEIFASISNELTKDNT